MSSMRDQCVWRPDAVSASFPENAPQAQRSSYQTTLTLLTHTLSEKQSRLSTRPLNGAIMTSKLPGALPGLFQPIDLSLIPLPSLIATTSNDLIAYIKDKEAIIKALNNPDDAVVDRIAALIRAADDTDIVLDSDSRRRLVPQKSSSPSSTLNQLESPLIQRLLDRHDDITTILDAPITLNTQRRSLRNRPQFLDGGFFTSRGVDESDIMILDDVSLESDPDIEIQPNNESMPIESFPNITIDLSYHEPEIGSAPTTYPHVSSIRGINNCIGNIRRWLEQKELKANRKEVSLPEELFTSLISEFNLRASQNDTASLKEIDPQDIEFILQCISGQVRVGMQAVEKTASCQSEEMVSRYLDAWTSQARKMYATHSACSLKLALILSKYKHVETILEFTKRLQRRLVFPRLDSLYQEVSGVAKVEFETSSDMDDEYGDMSDERSSSLSEDKGRTRGVASGRNSRAKKSAKPSRSSVAQQVDPRLIRMNLKLADIFRTMSAVLASGVSYPDTVALAAALCCLEAFYVENVDNLQFSCARVLACVFQKYPQLRHSLLEELVVSWPKVIRNGQIARTARLSNIPSKNDSISIFNLLVMEIVHGCAGGSSLSTWSHRVALAGTKDASSANGSVSEINQLELELEAPKNSGTYLGAKVVAKSLVDHLFNRCTTGSHSDVDYRKIVNCFVEDLLVCLFNPEWPAADLLLQLCTERLVFILKGSEVSVGGAHAPPAVKLSSFREQAVSHLGIIISAVKKESLLNDAANTLFTPPTTQGRKADSIDDPNATCPVCDRTWEQEFMICCDSCQRWFHGNCVSLAEASAPDSWMCDACLVVEQVEDIRTHTAQRAAAPTRKGGNKQKAPQPPVLSNREDLELLVAKQFVWGHLTLRSLSYPSCADALQYLLTQWSLEAKHEADANIFLAWSKHPHQRAAKLSSTSLALLFSRLILRHPIWADLMRPLSYILYCLQDKDAKLRRAALRSLQKVLSVYPVWMADPKIFTSIRARFLDSGISVREAALDIVGDFMTADSELAKQYYIPVVAQINDPGISVRKRVVRIMKALLLSEHTKRIMSVPDICARLSSRIRDDAAIKTVVLGMFSDMWIKGTLQPDPKEDMPHLRAASFSLQLRVDQILEVVAVSLTSAMASYGDIASVSWFVDLARAVLGNNSDKPDTVKKLAANRESLVAIAETVYATALSAEVEPGSNDKRVSRRVASFVVLHLLARADPNLIAPLVEQLAPLLKTRDLSAEWSHCLVHLCSTLELTLIAIAASRDVQPIVAVIEEDLIMIAKHFATNVVQVSIKTVCNIIQATLSSTDRIEKLFSECYLQLREDLQLVSKQDIAALRRVLRNMFSIGAICRYFSFPDVPRPSGKPVELSVLKSVKYGSHIEKVYSIYQEYWKTSSNVDIRALCVRGLAFLFSAYPGILLRSEPILKTSLSAESHEKLKIQALLGLSDFMDEEDERAAAAVAASATATNKNTSTQLASEIYVKLSLADSGVSATIPQLYLASTCTFVLSPQVAIRTAAMGLLKRLMRRGLVLHAKVVAPLIAVHLAHYGTSVGHDALLMLTESSMDLQSIGFHLSEAVYLASKFQVQAGGQFDAIVATQTLRESALSRLWTMIREQKQIRNNFFISLIRVFEKCLSIVSPKEEEAAYLAAKFAIMATASLPFQREEEVLFFISQLNNLIGGHLISEVLATSSAIFEAPSADLVPIIRRCEISLRLILLKKFLKSFYHITPARLASFTGNEPVSKSTPCSTKTSIYTADLTTPFLIDDIPCDWGKALEEVLEDGRKLQKLLKKVFRDDEQETNLVEFRASRVTRKRRAPNREEVAPTDENAVPAPKPRPAKRRKTKEVSDEDEDDGDYMAAGN